MENLKSPLMINLMILFAYSIIIRVWVIMIANVEYSNLSIAIYSMFAIGFQVIINLFFARKIFSADLEKREIGKTYLLCTFIVLLIGFPSCLVNSMVL